MSRSLKKMPYLSKEVLVKSFNLKFLKKKKKKKIKK